MPNPEWRIPKKHLLLKAQECKCAYCGEPITAATATFDHVRPESLGGGRRGRNLVLACKPCNTAKGCRPPTPREREIAKAIYKRVKEIYGTVEPLPPKKPSTSSHHKIHRLARMLNRKP